MTLPFVRNILASPGIKTQLYFTLFDKQTLRAQFCYLSYKSEFIGWMLELKFKQEDFYKHLFLFTVELSREYNLLDSDTIYNSFLYQLRTGLESIPISTISNLEIDQLHMRKGHEGYLVSPFGVEILPFVTRKEFYQGLLGSVDFERQGSERKYTYILMNGRNGLFKIGRSKHPLKREKTLEGQDPDNILISCWEAEPSFETELHELFLAKRKRGEWFELGMRDIMKLKKHIKKYKNSRE
jgi:hypothetical protein